MQCVTARMAAAVVLALAFTTLASAQVVVGSAPRTSSVGNGPHDGLAAGHRPYGVEMSFRRASVLPLPGFEELVYGHDEVIYVDPETFLTRGDIASSETTISGNAGHLTLRLTETATRRLETPEGGTRNAKDGIRRSRLRLPHSALRNRKPGRLAIFVTGRLMAAPEIAPRGTTGSIVLKGLLPGQAQRLGRLLSAAPSAPTGPLLTIVPSETAIAPGSTVTVTVFLSGVADLRGLQVALDVTGGLSGTLVQESVSIAVDRPDYVFGSRPAVSSTDPVSGRLLSALYSGGVVVTEAAYVGTYVFRASPDAQGTFIVNVRTNQETLLRDSKGLAIGFRIGEGAAISLGMAPLPPRRR